jgi:hypothetical protein
MKVLYRSIIAVLSLCYRGVVTVLSQCCHSVITVLLRCYHGVIMVLSRCYKGVVFTFLFQLPKLQYENCMQQLGRQALVIQNPQYPNCFDVVFLIHFS